jgi:hypothetical protein
MSGIEDAFVLKFYECLFAFIYVEANETANFDIGQHAALL